MRMERSRLWRVCNEDIVDCSAGTRLADTLKPRTRRSLIPGQPKTGTVSQTGSRMIVLSKSKHMAQISYCDGHTAFIIEPTRRSLLHEIVNRSQSGVMLFLTRALRGSSVPSTERAY